MRVRGARPPLPLAAAGTTASGAPTSWGTGSDVADQAHWSRTPADAWLIFLDDLLAEVYRVEPPTLAERLAEPKVAMLDQRRFRAVRPGHVEGRE